MHETPAELRDLQVLLDDCRADAGTHLRSIFRDERRMSAAQVVRELAGVFVLHVATVTAQGRRCLPPSTDSSIDRASGSAFPRARFAAATSAPGRR